MSLPSHDFFAAGQALVLLAKSASHGVTYSLAGRLVYSNGSLLLTVPAALVRGAFELKRCDRTKSRVSADQRAFLQSVDDSGGFAAICYGFEEFKRAYADFLEFVRERS